MKLSLYFALIFFISHSLMAQEKIQFAKNLDPNETYEVFLLAGQSNMEGQGKIDDIMPEEFKNVHYFDFGLNSNLEKPKGNFGPEVGLAKILEQNFPNRKFILIKYAIGGSSLLDWAPKYKIEKAMITGHPEFGNMYDRLLHLTDSLTQGYQTDVKGILWMQGERDARIPEAGKDYYKNFKSLIKSLRRDLGIKNLPFVFGKVNPPAESYPALSEVNQAQLKVARKIKNTFLISTDGLEKWNDKLHYSSQGQMHLGSLFGLKSLEILSD